MRHFNIAIDGPAGAGKSTIAKAAAKKLGFIYVDTGAMYRAMAVYFLDRGIGSQEEEKIREACNSAEITIRMASRISVYLPVREKLVKLQQQLAKTSQVIMDGRDIGTCVLPDAQAKIYLTASAKVRARRRFQELKAKGQECSLEEIQKEIEDRDYRDMHREHSPLSQAEDAVLVDTSAMTIEQVIDRIIQIAEEKGLHEDSTWK